MAPPKSLNPKSETIVLRVDSDLAGTLRHLSDAYGGNLSALARDALANFTGSAPRRRVTERSPAKASARPPRETVAQLRARVSKATLCKALGLPVSVDVHDLRKRARAVLDGPPEGAAALRALLGEPRPEWAGAALVALTDPWFAQAPGASPAPPVTAKESERDELERLRAEGLASLTPVERAEAAKITDGAHRARFIAARRARRGK